jgi:uncharacterized tellurite resistance protein B-like protein
MGSVAHAARFKGAQLIVGAQDDAEIYDARFLLSTLLVYVAKSDGSISALESNRMVDLLSAQLRISTPEALERLTAAIMALADDREIAATLQRISRDLSVTERQEIFAMMLDVMAVDDTLDPGEIKAATLAGQILGYSPDTIHTQLRSLLRAQKKS